MGRGGTLPDGSPPGQGRRLKMMYTDLQCEIVDTCICAANKNDTWRSCGLRAWRSRPREQSSLAQRCSEDASTFHGGLHQLRTVQWQLAGRTSLHASFGAVHQMSHCSMPRVEFNIASRTFAANASPLPRVSVDAL